MKLIDTVINDDILRGLKMIPDSSVSLIFTSPPYNVDIPYGDHHNDKMPYTEYLKWLKSIFVECNRILRPGGRLVINIDSMVNHEEDRIAEADLDSGKEYFRPIYADLCNIGRDIGLNFRCDIAWDKHQVVGRATAWGSFQSCSNPTIRRRHEYLLVWSKGPWRLEPEVEGAKSDLTKPEFEQWSMSYWPIKPETVNRGGHPVPFALTLANRVIKFFSYPGDTVVDPFCGAGTTLLAAAITGRHYIGIELAKKWADYATNRVADEIDMFTDDVEFVPPSASVKNREKPEETDCFTEEPPATTDAEPQKKSKKKKS